MAHDDSNPLSIPRAPQSSIDSFGSGAWILNGFYLPMFGADQLPDGQRYCVVVDFSAASISGSYNFGKLFDGGGNGYRRFT